LIGTQLSVGVQAKRLYALRQVVKEDLLQKEGYNKNDFKLNCAIGIKFPFGTSLEPAGTWYWVISIKMITSGLTLVIY
jgi:hypothetical protein